MLRQFHTRKPFRATWTELVGRFGGICLIRFHFIAGRACEKFSHVGKPPPKETYIILSDLSPSFHTAVSFFRIELRNSHSSTLFRSPNPRPPAPEISKPSIPHDGPMGSGDESKPSTLYDPSAATQPLLSSADPAALPPDANDDDDDDQYPPISYQYGPRPLRDLPALLLFLLISLSTIALGFVAVARRNPAASRASSFVFDAASSSCVLPSSNLLSLSLSPSSSPFLKDLIWTLVVTLLLAGPIALFVLWVLHHYAKQVVYAALPFFIIIPTFVNIYWFAACSLSDGCRHSFPLAYRILALIFIFLLIVIILWIIVANWHRIELTVRIVQIAAAALTDNISLLAVLPTLGLGLLVYFAPIVVFLVFSTWNGKVVPKEKEGAGGEYYLCVWRQDGWVPAYFALAIITMIWSAATMVEAQVYVTSGTIAQWYFASEGSKPSRSMRSSLRYG